MIVTRLLVLLNVAAFVWELIFAGPTVFVGLPERSPIDRFILAPIEVTRFHEYYRIITAGLLHANISHILVNMISLLSLGAFVEREAGSVRMLFIYVVSLLASGLAIVYFSDPYVGTLGASGAIFGLFGALFAIGLKCGPRGMELIRANLGILVLNLVFTFAVPFISKQAHLGGLLAGFVFTLLVFWPPAPVAVSVVDSTTGAALESHVEP